MEGGRWEVGVGGGDVLQQRYLPNAWSRNTNTAAVMTETEAQRKMEKQRRLVVDVFSDK